PLHEQFGVRSGNILLPGNGKFPGHVVNPPRRSLDLAEVSNGSFIDHNVTGAIRPFAAEFLVSESGPESCRGEDLRQSSSILHRSFYFPAGFVPSDLALVLICNGPLRAILAYTQQGAAPPQWIPGQIVECIHLMGTLCDQAKSRGLQPVGYARYVL